MVKHGLLRTVQNPGHLEADDGRRTADKIACQISCGGAGERRRSALRCSNGELEPADYELSPESGTGRSIHLIAVSMDGD